MKRVSYVFPVSHHYRLPFHEKLRAILASHEVDYRVVYCEPGEENKRKNDAVEIPWGKKVGLTELPFGLTYQHGLREALNSDLVIIQQENRLALNYILNFSSIVGLKKVAYFGHGRNFQSRNPSSRSEQWKRLWATKVDWWFGYTDETRKHVSSLGFPTDRITVFNNSVDVSALRRQVEAVMPGRLSELKDELGLVGRHVGIFVGGIYPDKRMPFLVAAADRVREILPDFEMIVVGGGSDLPVIQNLASSRPWIKVTGPKFGQDKVELMMLGQVFMMPGLMGLAILDAAVAGLPIATTAFPWHSPEIAYLESGRNGIMVQDWENPAAYGEAVADILRDEGKLFEMSQHATATAQRFSIESMAEKFAGGVLSALAV